MKAVLNRQNQSEFYPGSNENLLTTTYPQLYCPRCGSYEIGLRKLKGTEAIWGCKDCTAEFTLDFPGHRRF
jgi:transposase-like protein